MFLTSTNEEPLNGIVLLVTSPRKENADVFANLAADPLTLPVKPPSKLPTNRSRLLLNPGKTQILAQAILVDQDGN